MFEDRLALLEGAEACRAHGLGHGGGAPGADRPAARRRPRGGRQGAVRLLPLDPQQLGAAVRRRDHLRRRARYGGLESGGAAQHQGRSSSRARPIRCWRSPTSPRWRRSPARSAPRWSSTTSSPPRSSRSRCSWAPTSWSIRPPSTSTARAGCWAARSWARPALLDEAYRDFIRHTGPALSPFNAWVLLNGLETLDLRVRAQSATAATPGRPHRRAPPR